MKTKLFSFFIVLLVFASTTNAQVFDKIGSDVHDFISVGGDFFAAPFHFDSQDWTNLGATAAVVGGSFFLDNTARKFSQQNHTDFKNSLFDIDKYYMSTYAAIATAGIYGYGLFAKNDKIRNLGVQIGESVIYAGVITVSLKSILGRSRPYTENGHMSFKPFSVSDANVSFPSGHATVAFAFSTVMAHQVDNIYWKIGWFSAAGLVASARVYHDKHWISDVLMGGAIGYFVGRFVVHHPLNNKDDNQLSKKENNKPFYSVGINYVQNKPVYTLNFGYQF